MAQCSNDVDIDDVDDDNDDDDDDDDDEDDDEVQVGTATEIAVTTQLVETSDVCKRRFTPEERQCFFEDEIRMVNCNIDVGCRYEYSNCLFEAFTDQLLLQCGCDMSAWGVPSHDTPLCQGAALHCAQRLAKQMGKFDTVLDTLTNTTKTCISACLDTYYNAVTISSSSFPNPRTFLKSPESCTLATKLSRTCQDARRGPLEVSYPGLCALLQWVGENGAGCKEGRWNHRLLRGSPEQFNYSLFQQLLSQYARENTALVTSFLSTPFTQILGIDEDTSVIEAIGGVGGLLGLFMGFSVLTVAEVGAYLVWCISLFLPQVIYFLCSIVADTLTSTSRVIGPSRRERRLMVSTARDTQAKVAPGQDRDGNMAW